MTTSSLLRHGPLHAATLLEGLSTWMARKGFDTVGQLRGKLAVRTTLDETAHERAGYVTAVREADAGTYRP
jgi:dihydroorotate dehydrogenase (fumarate)